MADMMQEALNVRLWPLAAAPAADSRGSFRGQSGHPTLTASRQLVRLRGLSEMQTEDDIAYFSWPR
jgi:hypothetical protein